MCAKHQDNKRATAISVAAVIGRDPCCDPGFDMRVVALAIRFVVGLVSRVPITSNVGLDESDILNFLLDDEAPGILLNQNSLPVLLLGLKPVTYGVR